MKITVRWRQFCHHPIAKRLWSNVISSILSQIDFTTLKAIKKSKSESCWTSLFCLGVSLMQYCIKKKLKEDLKGFNPKDIKTFSILYVKGNVVTFYMLEIIVKNVSFVPWRKAFYLDFLTSLKCLQKKACLFICVMLLFETFSTQKMQTKFLMLKKAPMIVELTLHFHFLLLLNLNLE